MPHNSLDLPLSARGTMKVGERICHMERSVTTGQLMFVDGPDTRDWAAIDAGALDYSVVAQQEHAIPGFTGHDSQRIQGACPICNSEMGAAALRDPKIAAQRLTEESQPPVSAPASGPVPDLTPEQQAEVDARQAARQAEQAAAEEQARRDQIEKYQTTLAGLTGAADPALNAGVPPTDPDVVAGARPEVQAQAVATGAVTQAEVDAAKPAPERPTHGTDPFTGETVPIYWKIPGADADHPYGAKKDGSPRKPVGRKAGS